MTVTVSGSLHMLTESIWVYWSSKTRAETVPLHIHVDVETTNYENLICLKNYIWYEVREILNKNQEEGSQ